MIFVQFLIKNEPMKVVVETKLFFEKRRSMKKMVLSFNEVAKQKFNYSVDLFDAIFLVPQPILDLMFLRAIIDSLARPHFFIFPLIIFPQISSQHQVKVSKVSSLPAPASTGHFFIDTVVHTIHAGPPLDPALRALKPYLSLLS